MTLLSRKADYALLILSHLNQQKLGGNARILADHFGLSRPFVANILKELCHHGFVTSQRGVKGGYALARNATDVTLAEVLAAMEDGFRLTTCTDPEAKTTPCTLEASCPIKEPMGEIHKRIMGVLRGVTLSELFTNKNANTGSSSSLPMLSTGTCCGSTVPSEVPSAVLV